MGVEVFGLDEAQRDFLVDLNVKPSTCGQGESGCRERGIAGAQIRNVGAAIETQAHPAEVHIYKWLESALVAKGNPRSEQKGKRIPANVGAYRGTK